MGRYDFRPLRVHQAATRMLEANRSSRPPAWYATIGRIPAAEPLIRNQPLQHCQVPKKRRKTGKASRMYAPQPITYEEDRLRKAFFRDHPWELARPRFLIEDDGKDSYDQDYSQLRQSDGALTGENVVQRQLWLLENNPQMSKASAYDQARQEFYHQRLQEDTERRVAREEAVYTGACFGPSPGEIGAQIEDQQYEKWREWAHKEVLQAKQRQAALYPGAEQGDISQASSGELRAAVGEVDKSIPRGQEPANTQLRQDLDGSNQNPSQALYSKAASIFRTAI